MKKYYKSLTFLLLTVSVLFVCSSCSSTKRYYSKRENYINAVGTLTYLAYNDDSSALYLGFSELSPKFDDTCFKIVGENMHVVKKRDIDSKIKIGDRVEFITAPKYFGDGYVYPIVALSVNGECLLVFEEGFSNLLEFE